MIRRSTVLVTLAAVAAAALVAPRACAAAEKAADDVDRLIRDLGSDDWQARQKATKALKKMGQGALAKLEEAYSDSKDLEVRWRLKEILARVTIETAVGKPIPILALGKPEDAAGLSGAIEDVTVDYDPRVKQWRMFVVVSDGPSKRWGIATGEAPTLEGLVKAKLSLVADGKASNRAGDVDSSVSVSWGEGPVTYLWTTLRNPTENKRTAYHTIMRVRTFDGAKWSEPKVIDDPGRSLDDELVDAVRIDADTIRLYHTFQGGSRGGGPAPRVLRYLDIEGDGLKSGPAKGLPASTEDMRLGGAALVPGDKGAVSHILVANVEGGGHRAFVSDDKGASWADRPVAFSTLKGAKVVDLIYDEPLKRLWLVILDADGKSVRAAPVEPGALLWTGRPRKALTGGKAGN